MSAKILIYILTYNEATLKTAKQLYGHFNWARFVILPPTILFENYMYDEWFLNNYDEWKDYDYVGTLAWKAHTKILIPDMAKLADFLYVNKYDVVPFYVIDDINHLDSNDRKHPNNKKILKIIFDNLGYPNDYIKNKFIEFYCNYWIATPKVMLDYINIFKKCKAIINSNQDIQKLIWNYTEYSSELNDEILLKIFGKLSYSYHPFIYERIPYLYLSKYTIAYPYMLYQNNIYPPIIANPNKNTCIIGFWKNRITKTNNSPNAIFKNIDFHELHNTINRQLIIKM